MKSTKTADRCMFLYVHVTFTHRFVVEKTVFGYIQIKVRVIPLKVRVTANPNLV